MISQIFRNSSKLLKELGGGFGECPKCKAQMRIIAFIQDALSIKDIMTAQGIPDFQAPPPIPKFIDTSHAIDELPQYDALEPSPDDF